MNTSERMALQGLLLLVVELQNRVRGQEDHVDVFHEFDQIRELADSDHAREIVQLARALLDKPAPKVFYGIVTEHDCSERYRERHEARRSHPDNPIIFEQYLCTDTADVSKMEARAKGFTDYGWVRVAEIHVDIPEAKPQAIPAAVAGVHT